MQTNVVGLLNNAANVIPRSRDIGGWRFALRELGRNLKELHDRHAAGDATVVDEFFRCYVVDQKPTEGTPK